MSYLNREMGPGFQIYERADEPQSGDESSNNQESTHSELTVALISDSVVLASVEKESPVTTQQLDSILQDTLTELTRPEASQERGTLILDLIAAMRFSAKLDELEKCPGYKELIGSKRIREIVIATRNPVVSTMFSRMAQRNNLIYRAFSSGLEAISYANDKGRFNG